MRRKRRLLLPVLLTLLGAGPCQPDPGPADMAAPDLAQGGAVPDLATPAPDLAGTDNHALAVCVRGWCWENPLPLGDDLNASFVLSPTDVLIGGTLGTLLRWNGTTWRRLPFDMSSVDKLWASGANDIWVIGNHGSVLWRGDGTTWSQIAIPGAVPQNADYVNDIWGTGANDVWLSGSKGGIMHWDGTGLYPVPVSLPPAKAMGGIYGIGPQDIWFNYDTSVYGTLADNVLHWDGKAVRTVSTALPGTNTYISLAALAKDDVWAISRTTAGITHWDGTAFKPVANPGGTYDRVWASGRDDVWFSGTSAKGFKEVARWDGDRVSVVPLPQDWLYELRYGTAISGTGPDDVWLLPSTGALLRISNGTFQALPSTEQALQFTRLGKGDAWLHGQSGALRRWDGTTLKALDQGVRTRWNDGWSDAPGRSWVVSDDGVIYRNDGTGWRSVPNNADNPLYALWGSGADDVWTVGGNGTVMRWDGQVWSKLATPTKLPLYSVWGSGPDDVWIAGYAILHWDGKAMTQVTSPYSVDFHTVWGSGPKDVWFGGNYDNVMHWDGQTMTNAPLGSGAVRYVQKFIGTGPGDIWAYGTGGITHWDGTTWGPVPRTGLPAVSTTGGMYKNGTGTFLSSVYAPDVAHQSLYRWNGLSWALVDANPYYFGFLWGDGAGNVWSAWDGGKILHRKPQ